MDKKTPEKVKYPIGQQDFKVLRQQGRLYVDKTRYIEQLVEEDQYYFLARPRRFGKSLFLSTLKYFFEGERELFKGLYIDSIEWNWEKYPVLHLDLNPERYFDKDTLENILNARFEEWEKAYDIKNDGADYSRRFRRIIENAHKKTGRQVAILVDEYDKPLVGNLNRSDHFEYFQEKLASIYSNFKSSAEHIKLVFITGVSRFSKLSVFSDLNNLRDISFSEDFANICGITEAELHQYFIPGIQTLADKEGISFEEACVELKLNYDGYRFSRGGSDIYNPWSVLNAMRESVVYDYWAETGKPTIVVEALRNLNVDLEKILNTDCTLDQLKGLDLSNIDPLPLLYQTGYLTIKAYDRETKLFNLGIPNREVSRDLFKALLPYYISVERDTPDSVARDILNAILKGEPAKMMESIDIFLAGIPYEMKIDDENNFHNAIYILLRLIGARTETEVHTSDGRIDVLVKTPKFIYIIELKFGKDSQTAINQIEKKQYDIQFRLDPRQVFHIGANFNNMTRRLEKPEIRKIEPSLLKKS